MTKSTLMEFPCLFPVKIIGINNQNFIDEIKQTTLNHFPNFKEEDLTQKLSEQNNYLALTVTVLAENQLKLNAFYQDITKNKHVKMAL
jgi:uncharacterized protein